MIRNTIFMQLATLMSVIFQLSVKPSLAQSTVTIRVAAWNIEFFDKGSPKEIAEVFHPLNLDIIAIEEIPAKAGYPTSGDLVQALNLLERQGRSSRVWKAFTGTIGSGLDDRKFKAILSHLPMSKKGEIALPSAECWKGGSAVHADLKISGIAVTALALHVPGIPENKQRMIDSPVIINNQSEVLIAMGDYNEKLGGPGDKILRKAGFKPVWDSININLSEIKTHDILKDHVNSGVIDHIYYKGNNVRVTNGGVLKLHKPLSNHYPVWAELEMVY